GLDIVLTTDKNLRYQQNSGGRSIAIVVLSSTSWSRIPRAVGEINRAIKVATPGSFHEVEIPRSPRKINPPLARYVSRIACSDASANTQATFEQWLRQFHWAVVSPR